MTKMRITQLRVHYTGTLPETGKFLIQVKGRELTFLVGAEMIQV